MNVRFEDFFFRVAALCWVNQLCCFCNSNDTLYFFVLHFVCQKKQYSIGYVAFLSITNLNYYVGFFLRREYVVWLNKNDIAFRKDEKKLHV